MIFKVLGEPRGKARPRITTINGYSHAYKTKEDEMYEWAVKRAFRAARTRDYDLYEKPIAITIEARFPIPSSFSKKRAQQALEGKLFPLKKPDADNIAKIVCDALNGEAYRDDKQVVCQRILKVYAAEPAVVIQIDEWS